MKQEHWESAYLCQGPPPQILLMSAMIKQAISAHEWALCQLTVCFKFQSRSDRRKGHKSCALEMVLLSYRSEISLCYS